MSKEVSLELNESMDELTALLWMLFERLNASPPILNEDSKKLTFFVSEQITDNHIKAVIDQTVGAFFVNMVITLTEDK